MVNIIHGQQKILIVEEKSSQLGKLLKDYLKRFDNHLFVSPEVPHNLNRFDYCFFINKQSLYKYINSLHTTRIIAIYMSDKKIQKSIQKKINMKSAPHIKFVFYLPQMEIHPHHIEEIVWFGISKTTETVLYLKGLPKKKELPKAEPSSPKIPLGIKIYSFFEKTISKKNITIAALLGILIYHVAFFFPLLYGSAYVYQAIKLIKENKTEQSLSLMKKSKTPFFYAKKLYNLARPTFLLFSVAQIPDDLFSVYEKGGIILDTSIALQKDLHTVFGLITKKNKSISEKKILKKLLSSTQQTLSNLEDSLIFLNQKIPKNISALQEYKESLVYATNTLSKLKKISPFFTQLLAEDMEKKYLLLFANNMELRPGGGFIGSYGVITVSDFTLSSIEIFDVYDADGQLTAHVDPPNAIKDYLKQPHWFLRDSAFSPDFYDNYNQALYFLEKEGQSHDFAGGVLFTTTAIRNILRSFGNIYLPDYREMINSENFYIKTQLYAEKDFFPGSTQKKSFLSAITKQLLAHLETASPVRFLLEILKSIEEKQLTFYIENESLQNIIDSYYWSGRIIEPQCPQRLQNCYTDFMFPYDANLGVNKANFYVNRIMDAKIAIDEDGFIHSSLTVKFKNESLQDIFPGGVYKNYFQMLMPRDSLINKITLNNEILTQYDQSIKQFKQIGFYFEVPIQKTAVITIEYQSIVSFKKGRNVYQLLFQKQIGSINNDLSLEITLPPSLFMVNQNFSPLVKNNRILYNTDLSADKVFFIELLKE